MNLPIDLDKLSEEERRYYMGVCSGLDPIFFMRNFIKIRSQPDTDDEREEGSEHNLPSHVVKFAPWPKQEEVVQALLDYFWVIGPKSRKIGFTTTGIAFGAWVQKFIPDSRVHYFSRRDDAAMNMLQRHIFMMEHLPDWMRLPVKARNSHTYTVYNPTTGDERTVQAYPVTEDAAIEETADYTLLDEFASIREPLASKMWAGIEPTIAPGGYCLMISRGKGPQGTFARLVRQAAIRQGMRISLEAS